MEVHPFAEIFPMMSDDELAELASDIKANGQVHPIVLSADGQTLIDGRNRLKACEIAGVKPEFTRINGEDVGAYILASNVHRRHMSAGQRAMATAMIYPEVEKGGRGKRGQGVKAAEAAGFSSRRLNEARSVLRHSPEIAKAVLAGVKPLDDALEMVRLGEVRLADDRNRLKKLRKERPDLAARVVDSEITLADAEKQAKADADQLQSTRWAATMNVIDCVQLADRNDAENVARLFDPAMALTRNQEITSERLRRCAAFLSALADNLEEGRHEKI